MMQVFAIIGAALLFIAAVFEVLLVAGLPLGEFTMGGRYKVLPPMMRGAAVFSLLTQVFAGLILIQAAGFMGMWFSFGVTRIICYVFGGFFVVNTVMKDLIRLMDPRYIEVWGKFLPRGGISIDPYANYGRPGTKYERLAEERFRLHDMAGMDRVDNR